MDHVLDTFVNWGKLFLTLAPFLLVGLFLAGLLHILVSKRHVAYIGGDPGMRGIFYMSLLGVTLPVCSCGVAPVAIELERKGASRQSIISFLILAPETSIDTFFLTYGLLGPAMAFARPCCGYLLGIIGGIFGIGLLRENDAPKKADQSDVASRVHSHTEEELAEESDYIGFHKFSRAFQRFPRRVFHKFADSRWFYSWYRPQNQLTAQKTLRSNEPTETTIRDIFRHIFRYSYGRLADDILPGLLMGLVISFFILLLLPNDLSKFAVMKKGLFPYLIMFLAGIPLYVCASEGTLMAAAFIYKGISPGAVLVFLLTGPVSNIPTVMILTRYFGIRFVKIYLLCVMIGGIILGILFDYFLEATGLKVKPVLQPHQPLVSFIMWSAAIALIGLILWRFFRGHLCDEFRELGANLKAGLPRFSGIDARDAPWYTHFSWRSRFVRYLAVLAIVVYLASGLSVVPIGGVGYVRVFGRVVWKDLVNGLHYIPPYPFSVLDIWYPTYPKEVFVNLNSSLSSAESKEKDGIPEFLSGDEYLSNLTASVQYVVTDPYRYYYQINDPQGLISDFLHSSLTEIFANKQLLDAMTDQRGEFQAEVTRRLVNLLNAPSSANVHLAEIGVKVIALNLLDFHPLQEVLFAFRDVISAREDRETSNLKALSVEIQSILKSRGQAVFEVETAKALAFSEKAKAQGLAKNLLARGRAVAKRKELLENLLWLQTSERALSRTEQLYLLPPGTPPQKFTLWRSQERQNEELLLKQDGKNKENSEEMGKKKDHGERKGN